MSVNSLSISWLLFAVLLTSGSFSCSSPNKNDLKREVNEEVLREIYEEVKTPYKYGLVMVPHSDDLKLDCPSIFKDGDFWYMVYIIYGGRGYETWLAESLDLLNWETKGRLMSFSDTTDWDVNQKAGYTALQEFAWEGDYKWQPYEEKYWMSYIGGDTQGYEAGLLSIGLAYTDKPPTEVHEWERLEAPVLMSTDEDANWWENDVMYKSSIIWDKEELLGYPFVMYYNARGDSINPKRGAERIGLAVSDNMIDWQRYQEEPLINHHKGISGDAVIQQIDDWYVMFYFGAFWPDREDAQAFNRFAVSYDLLNWKEWEGEDLIRPSEPYDERFAHKSFVLKHEGVVYHFYCAVNDQDQRGIAVATSKDLGKSELSFASQETE